MCSAGQAAHEKRGGILVSEPPRQPPRLASLGGAPGSIPRGITEHHTNTSNKQNGDTTNAPGHTADSLLSTLARNGNAVLVRRPVEIECGAVAKIETKHVFASIYMLMQGNSELFKELEAFSLKPGARPHGIS